MSEESTFFLPVKDSCDRSLITCKADDSVAEAAIVMRDRSISSLIACCDEQGALGIITDHDLRSKVVADGRDPAKTRVREIMSSPLVTVHQDDTYFEALYQMSSNRIRRVGVVDDDGKLIGIVNESDIIRLQTRSPQKLLRSIDEAKTVEELKGLHKDCDELIIYLSHTGVITKELVRLISLLNDQLSLRLIEILVEESFADLPKGLAFLVLGSEGRREQTLKTDQDNAIIYSDDLTLEEIDKVRGFSQVLIDALIEVGVPECPGGIMAKNEFWRRSLGGWKDAIDGWIASPSGENILNFSMFSDMRTLWGDVRLERGLRDHIIIRARENGIFLTRMAANVCLFPPPIGFFGRIKTNKQGEHAGEVDLKKAGIFALTEGVKTLALEQGVLGGNTYGKLLLLKERGVLQPEQVDDIVAAFNLLSFFRLRGQVISVSEGREPDNFISPFSLNRIEKARLQKALEVVQTFESSLSSHFQVNLLNR